LNQIISFSLYGSAPRYCEGALRNLLLAEEVYPGWRCRFYVDGTVPQRYLRALGAWGAEIVAIADVKGPAHGLFWRFLVAGDPRVDRFLVRDADSRVNLRERAAVDEWLASGKSFHLMRDHPVHRMPILGGMWGGLGGRLSDMPALIDRWGKFDRWGRDQEFLREMILPRINGDYLCHDSAAVFPDAKPFPPHLPLVGSSFVGAIVSVDRARIEDWELLLGLARALAPERRRELIQLAKSLMIADEESARLAQRLAAKRRGWPARIWALRGRLPSSFSIRARLARLSPSKDRG